MEWYVAPSRQLRGRRGAYWKVVTYSPVTAKSYAQLHFAKVVFDICSSFEYETALIEGVITATTKNQSCR